MVICDLRIGLRRKAASRRRSPEFSHLDLEKTTGRKGREVQTVARPRAGGAIAQERLESKKRRRRWPTFRDE